MKKTHIIFVEMDDYSLTDMIKNGGAGGQGNSKDERLEYDFEYCIEDECNVRLLNGKPIVTKGILFPEDFEIFVGSAKKGRHATHSEIALQHTDFEALKRSIQKALELGKQNADKHKQTYSRHGIRL